MTKVKNILFRLNLKGNGIVNFDSSDQKFMFNGTNLNNMKTIHDNSTYAKKRFYKNGENLEYKLAISSNCLRHGIFIKDVQIQSANLIHNEMLLYSFIASPSSIMRGYLFADEKETLKRSGVLSITDAEQTCNALSYMETFTRSGAKDTDKDKEKADNSFFKKETVGNVKYQAHGFIDLMGLQFVSCDQIFDRYAFNPDMYNIYKQLLSKKLNGFNSELGYYQQKDSDVKLPEYGFRFSDENVLTMVRGLMERILTLEMRKANAYAGVESLEYKLVYDPLVDTMTNEDGWVELKNREDIQAINFEVEDFYTLENPEDTQELRRMLEEDKQKRKLDAKTAKAEETAKKAAAKKAEKEAKENAKKETNE